MPSSFIDRLKSGVLLADGAIGTLLHDRGVGWGKSLEQATLTNRAVVSGIHVDYLKAGAELLTTNTFSANRIRLAQHGLEDKVRDINLYGVKVAREAREITGRSAFVAGSVGAIDRSAGGTPSANRLATCHESFCEQIEALLEGGADVILLESFPDVNELLTAIDAATTTCDLPVIASMSFDADANLGVNSRVINSIKLLTETPINVLGINCSTGPHGALRMLESIRSVAGDLPISVMPNAGLPSRRGQAFQYISTPEYFAEYALRFIDAGATIVGGCCGTSPEHTLAMANAIVDAAKSSTTSISISEPDPSLDCERPQRLEIESTYTTPTRFAQALNEGGFVVSVELAPPKGINPEKVLSGASMLEQRGLEFVNITDGAMARARMGCVAVAKLVQEHTTLESIIHFTTRDRNLMALQSELIGAHAMNVRNVLALTGDPPAVGDFPDATGVWDIESMGLVEAIVAMNSGSDLRGRDIGESANFCVGCAVNPTSEDVELELERFEQKINAGAQFVMSQPLYDINTLHDFLERTVDFDVPFLLGILPLQSLKHAEFMHNEVPGIVVPREHRQRMADAGKDGVAAGISLAQELISEAQQHVDGIYLMPSFGRYEICADVLDALDSTRDPASNKLTTQGSNLPQ